MILIVDFNYRNWHRTSKSLPEFSFWCQLICLLPLSLSISLFISVCLSLFISIPICVSSSLSPFSANETMCELEGYDMKMCVHDALRGHTKYVILLFIIWLSFMLSSSQNRVIRNVFGKLLKINFENWIWRCWIVGIDVKSNFHNLSPIPDFDWIFP